MREFGSVVCIQTLSFVRLQVFWGEFQFFPMNLQIKQVTLSKRFLTKIMFLSLVIFASNVSYPHPHSKVNPIPQMDKESEIQGHFVSDRNGRERKNQLTVRVSLGK